MRLYLINPSNSLISMARATRWRKYRVWKPLGLLTVAALTPREWDVTVIDENLGVPDYGSMPLPEAVGITAFTSQAPRAYAIAREFRRCGVPVVMGGIHASMRPEEAGAYVDAVVQGEAEGVWTQVLDDVMHGTLKPLYRGALAELITNPPARHDLLPTGYAFGALETTRGCPLNCSFCSVSAFNGRRYRHRDIGSVVRELQGIPERLVLIVDDNILGTRPEHVARAKELFRAIAADRTGKRWVCQATINFGEDEELLELAHRAGCFGVFIGFESTSKAGLEELGKRFNIARGGDPRRSVERIHKHHINVAGSYIMGLDTDLPGVGRQIADSADDCGVDLLNVLFLTPLPGTRLWNEREGEGRIVSNRFPDDWKYYTLGVPVSTCRSLTWPQLRSEMKECWQTFYSPARMAARIWRSLRQRRSPLAMLIGNLSYLRNYKTESREARRIDETRSLRAAHDPHIVRPAGALPRHELVSAKT